MFDRKGTQMKRLGDLADFVGHRISPDGQKVAAGILDPGAGNYKLQVWARNNWTRLTFGSWRELFPVWSPDGNRIIFGSNKKGTYDLYVKPSNGTGNEELLVESNTSKFATSWSPDGRYVAYNVTSADKRRVEVWVLPLFGDRKPFPFLQADFNVGQARFSPDGRWMAYVADESGRVNVYVTPFPEGKGKWQVSADGGSMPRWRRDSKEIFYLSGTGQVMAAEVDGSGQDFQVGTVHPLFHALLKTGPSRYDLSATSEQIGYDSSPDGQWFVVNSPVDAVASPITLVTNWKPGRAK
jgi:Tol biopolymer transport system component